MINHGVASTDEIDALFGDRGEESTSKTMTAALIQEIDALERETAATGAGSSAATAPGMGGQVTLMAATNLLGNVDPALLRPGRFEHVVLVPSPDETGRLDVLRSLERKGVRLAPEVDLREIAGPQTIGFTGADLAHLIRRAALSALRSDPSAASIGQGDLRHALEEHRRAGQAF